MNMFFNMYMYFYIFMFLMGLVVFSLKGKHLLVTLLVLEYIVLSVFICLVFYMLHYSGDKYMILVFLGFVVCEAVLGLSVLVGLIRCCGNDYVNNLMFILW